METGPRRQFLARLGTLVSAQALASAGVDASWPASDDPGYWSRVRDEFDLRRDEVYLNTATLGCPPRAALQAMAASARDLAATLAEWDWAPGGKRWIAGYEPETALRERLGRLVHAEASTLSLTQNATVGASLVAGGLELSPGDEVVQTDQEHPGGSSAWKARAKRHGIVVKEVALPVPADDADRVVAMVAAAFTERTRVLAVPHVTSALGAVLPVKELCALARERGVFTLVDGAQAIGQVPVDLQEMGCDAYVASPHKWLHAPAGNGLLYVRRGAASRVATVLASGEWDNAGDPGYRLQQHGTANASLLVGLGAALDLHERIGPARVFARILELGDRLRRGLSGLDRVVVSSPTRRGRVAGMTTFRAEGVPASAMQGWLWDRARLRARSVGDAWGVRVSTAVYNSEAEVDRLLGLVRERVRT